MSVNEDPSVLPDGWTWSDVGHGALDIAGLVPVIGEAADLTNAAWHAAEGNYLDAGLSLISCVPVVGDIIGKGGKVLGKVGGKAGGKVVKEALEVLRKADFAKILEKFRANPKLAPHIDKMIEALNKWRDDILNKFSDAPPGGTAPCSKTGGKLANITTEYLKKIGPTEARRLLSSLPVSQRKELLLNLVSDEKLMDVSTKKGTAVFYSGKIKTSDGWVSARTMAEHHLPSGKTILEKTPGGRFLEEMNIYPDKKGLNGLLEPDDADAVWTALSKRYASHATGDVLVYVGEMRPGAVLPAEIRELTARKLAGEDVGDIKVIDMGEMFERLSK